MHNKACCCCCSVGKLCPTLCSPVNCSLPGFPVLHHLLEFAQDHVHWIGDDIQHSHPPMTPSHPALLSLSPHQGLSQSQLFASDSQSIGASVSASVLPGNIKGRFPLGWTGWISLQSKGFWRVFFNTSSKASILQWWAFFIVQLSRDYWKNQSFDYMDFVCKETSLIHHLVLS